MRPLTFCMLWCLVQFAPARASACEFVQRESIAAKDLARVVGAFAALPPDTVVAHSPVPGATRVLRALEILQVARKYSLALESAPDVCFAWQMEALDHDRVLEAMQKSFNLPGVAIRIVELSLYPVPQGVLSFAIERLGIPARSDRPSPVLWRGDVIYAGDRRFAIWARVEITAPVTRIMATAPLKSAEPILAEQVRVETGDGFPFPGKPLTLDAVIGMSPSRLIPAGAEIRSKDLAVPKAVNSGDSVSIEVRTEKTRLAFTAVAVTPGGVGETISVRNPESKKLFRAQVTGRGTAVVQPGWTGAK
jgi:flagellar basal body P-ring formation protein FlgA